MAKINVDFSQIPDNNMPEGGYEAEITGVEMRTGKENNGQPGNPYLNWEFTITDGDYTGRKVWMVTGLTEKSLWKLKETFEALGIEGDALDIEIDDDTNAMTEPEVIGIPVLVEVVQESYQGRTTSKASKIVQLLDQTISS